MFPKVIHTCWFQGLGNAPDGLDRMPCRWELLNPGWTVRVWDEGTLTAFIQREHPTWFVDWLGLSSVIKKCDLARLLLLWTYGGFYADLDIEPLRSLDSFLHSGERRFNRAINTRKLLDEHAFPERVDYLQAEWILSREYRPIDNTGFGIANGVMFVKQHSDLLLGYLHSRRGLGHLEVLEAFGPFALTRFIRENFEAVRGRVLVLPPSYLLWEDSAFDHSPPGFTVARHLAKNYWGDKAKKEWWKTH